MYGLGLLRRIYIPEYSLCRELCCSTCHYRALEIILRSATKINKYGSHASRPISNSNYFRKRFFLIIAACSRCILCLFRSPQEVINTESFWCGVMRGSVWQSCSQGREEQGLQPEQWTWTVTGHSRIWQPQWFCVSGILMKSLRKGRRKNDGKSSKCKIKGKIKPASEQIQKVVGVREHRFCHI